ncbi:hypothetical protein ACH5RR_003023 [Cinchona calisaya]|uniref:GDSL esterase/lipase n=1 Tax=Cinchona calisaya TaxID=153742 RepID=A0ABD3ATM4_9GENT
MYLGLPLLDPYLKADGSFKNGVNFAFAGAMMVPSRMVSISLSLELRRLTFLSLQLGALLFHLSTLYPSAIRLTCFDNTLIPFVQLHLEVIRLGAKKIVVPGTFPLGCLPANLVLLPPNDAKDDQGCSRSLNNLSIFFNDLLKKALFSLRLEFPLANIVYADYYNAFETLLRNGPALGENYLFF